MLATQYHVEMHKEMRGGETVYGSSSFVRAKKTIVVHDLDHRISIFAIKNFHFLESLGTCSTRVLKFNHCLSFSILTRILLGTEHLLALDKIVLNLFHFCKRCAGNTFSDEK